MWGDLSREVAASLSRQQEKFCSSIKDIDDSGQGWGDVGHGNYSHKGGWGKQNSAQSQVPQTGWGTKCAPTALRGWGSSQSPAAPPDPNSKWKNQTETVGVKPKPPAGLPPAKSNGASLPNGSGTSQGRPSTSNAPKIVKQGGAAAPKPTLINKRPTSTQTPQSSSVSKGVKPPNTNAPKPKEGTATGTAPAPSRASQFKPPTPPQLTTFVKTGGAPTTIPPNGATLLKSHPAPQTMLASAAKIGSNPKPSGANASPRTATSWKSQPSAPSKSPVIAGSNVSNNQTVRTAVRKENDPISSVAGAAAPSVAIRTTPTSRNSNVEVQRGTITTTSTQPTLNIPGRTKAEPLRTAPVATVASATRVPEEKKGTAMNDGNDMFIVVQSESERFSELVSLLRESRHRTSALLIVDESRTPSALLSAVLCMSGLPASPMSVKHTGHSQPIRVARSDELSANLGSAHLIVNVNMVDAFDAISKRTKFLEKNGMMRTFLLPAKDSVRAARLASMFSSCGLPVPQQLNSFLPPEDL